MLHLLKHFWLTTFEAAYQEDGEFYSKGLPALRYGPFAVHRTPGTGKPITIANVTTGARIVRTDNLVDAIRIVGLLNGIAFDWHAERDPNEEGKFEVNPSERRVFTIAWNAWKKHKEAK